MPRRSRGWPTSRASSCIRIPCAPRISIIPTSCASISIRSRASTWEQIREVARVVRATLDDLVAGRLAEDLGLTRHPHLRADRRRGGHSTRSAAPRSPSRAKSNAARPRSRRASGGRRSGTACSSTTTRTRRTARSRPPIPCGRRRTRASRRRCHGTRSTRASRRTSRWRRCRRASRRVGDRHDGDRSSSRARSTRCSSSRPATSGRAWATRRGRRNTGSRQGEPARVQPSRRRRTPDASAASEIARRSARRQDALAGLERWKARHPEAAAHLEPADVLVDAMRGRFATWTRIRVNLQHVPATVAAAAGAARPRRRHVGRLERRQRPRTARRAEHLRELVSGRDLELIVAAVGRLLVRAPALEDRGVTEAIALQVVVLHLADALDAQRLPREILARAPAALPAGHPLSRRSRRRPPTPATDARPARPSRSGASSSASSPALRHRERGRDADVMQRALVVVQPEQQRPDERARTGLVPAEAGDDAVGGARVLDLEHRALARADSTPSSGFAITPSRPAPSKRCSQSTASSRSRVIGVRWNRRLEPLGKRRSSRARRSRCGASRRSSPPTASRSKATNDAGVSFASFATRDAAGCRRSCSASKSSPCGVAMTISPSTTQPSGRRASSASCSSGK